MLGSRFARFAAACGVLVSFAAMPAPARADAVAPPPTNCPEGSVGESCHGGTYCQPATCKTNTDCSAGQVCQSLSFCQGQISCGGGLHPADAAPVYVPTVGAACAKASDCGDAGTCTTESVCVTPGSTGTAGSSGGTASGGCSCEAAGGVGGPIVSALMLAVGGVGLLSGARRRRGRQRPSAQRRA